MQWRYVVNDVIEVGKFYEKGLKKTNQKEFSIEKVVMRKGDKFYFKCKGYNSSFDSWIYKKT